MPDRDIIAHNSVAIEKESSGVLLPTSPDVVKAYLDPFSYAGDQFAYVAPAMLEVQQGGAPGTISDAVPFVIGAPGDIDFFGFNLTAGRTYMFSIRGAGVSPLADSFLYLLDNTFTVIDADDDGGDGVNSLLTYTATYTGLHVIGAAAYPSSGLTGTYSLNAFLQPLTDTVPSTFAGAVAIGLGTSYGFTDSAVPDVYGPPLGETDTYKFSVTAGKYYTIEVAGGADYASNYLALPPGELDPYIFVYNSLGDLITFNDDISFPADISSRVGFLATANDTFFLDVQSYAPWTGGYSITLKEVDLSTISPLDAIDWFSADNIDTGPGNVAKVYFALPGESWDELADNGIDPLPSFGWNAWEKQQVMMALQEFTKITGITYVETATEADAEFRLITTTSEQYGAYFYPQDPVFGDAQGIGAFNVDSGGWNFDEQQSLTRGGFSFAVILHEFGHAHGLAHPHDNGGGSDILAGVTGPFDSYGVYDLNQGVYTVMSYNDAWPLHPDGPSPFTAAGIDNGWSGSLSAFDIAVLQSRYGVHAYATGNNVYMLKDVQAEGTFYETIWDSGGTDEIRYNGGLDAQIDLLAATLDYSPTGGGVVSWVDGIKGGYTIANGVVIEKATGGDGDDTILGNGAANVLSGNNGNDTIMGRGGDDTITGGNGEDTVDGGEGHDTIDGGNQQDNLNGGGGNDLINGGNQNDVLNGGAGNDTLNGGNQNDTLSGGDDNDLLDGGNQDDVLNGDGGNDTLNGGNQNDVLNGGAGDDILTGGNQSDIFVFSEIGGNDRIMDFSRPSDKINLTAIDAVAGGADNAFSWIGGAAFSGVAGQLRAYSSAGNHFVAGDVNGDGVADFTIQTNILIIASDIVL